MDTNKQLPPTEKKKYFFFSKIIKEAINYATFSRHLLFVAINCPKKNQLSRYLKLNTIIFLIFKIIRKKINELQKITTHLLLKQKKNQLVTKKKIQFILI